MPASADILDSHIKSGHHPLLQLENPLQPHVIVDELHQHWEVMDCSSNRHEDHHRQQVVHAR